MFESCLEDLQGDFHCCEIITEDGKIYAVKKYEITEAQRDFLRTTRQNEIASIQASADFTQSYKDQAISKIQAELDAIG